MAGCRLHWRLKVLKALMCNAVFTAVESLAEGEICAKPECAQQQAAVTRALVPYTTFVAPRDILETAT